MGATPTYLFRRRNGIYYFRTRIPSDLQPHFARSEISRSLKTRDPSAAIRLARMYIVQLQTAFDSIRDIHMRQRTELTELITISRTVQKGDKTETTEIKIDRDDPNEERDVAKGLIESLSGTNHAVPTHSETSKSGTKLSQLIEEYCTEKRSTEAWTSKTEAENRAIYDLMIRVMGDLPMYAIQYSYSPSIQIYSDEIAA
jgi:Domain of unknown function (DUF6538)